MPNEFYTLITNSGAAKLAAAIDAGTYVPLTHLAVGDGDNGAVYEPTADQTALKNETYRVGLQSVDVDPQNANWVVINGVVPPEEGGWHIREVGIFDAAGDLFAIAKVPEIYKPVLTEGSGSDVDLKITLEIGNADTVQMVIDPSAVYAPKSWVTQQITDHQNTRDHPDGDEDNKGFLQLATVLETIEGLLETKATHPLGVAALLEDLITLHEQTRDHPDGDEDNKGFLQLASEAETIAGLENAKAVHPLGLAAALAEMPDDVSAYVYFDGSVPGLTIFKSKNVSSLVDLGTGYYRINFINPAADTNYLISGTATNRQTYPTGPQNLTTLAVVEKFLANVEVSSQQVGDFVIMMDASIMDVVIHGGNS